MAKGRTNTNANNKKKLNGIVKLKFVIEKLVHGSLLNGKKSTSSYRGKECEEINESTNYIVPKDVKEGHFAVVAVDGDSPRRFIVPLNFLTHPRFLELLEQAAEEYGFDCEGTLTIPCRPSELESILAGRWKNDKDSSVDASWGRYNNTMVKNC